MSGTPVFDTTREDFAELEKLRQEVATLREDMTYVRAFCEELTKVFETLGNSPMARMLPIGQFKMPEGM